MLPEHNSSKPNRFFTMAGAWPGHPAAARRRGEWPWLPV